LAFELTCKACGQSFRNEDKEQLFREVEQHNRQQHNMTTSLQEFEARCQQTPARA